MEDQILAKLRQQPVGHRTLEDFQLPEAFLRRVARRIVRLSYQQRFRMVARGQRSTAPAEGAATQADPRSDPMATDALPARSRRAYGLGLVGLAAAAAVVVAVVVAVILLRRRRTTP